VNINSNVTCKNIIGVDIDNVLSDTDLVIRELIEQEYGIKASREHITSWDYFNSIQITIEQEDFIFDLFYDKYCLQTPAIELASESLTILSTDYLIWLVTSRPTKTDLLTKQWLIQHNINYDKLIYSNSKVDYLDTIKLLIDDNGETAIEYATKGVPVILFNYPWNTEYRNPLIFRVDNWHQALDIIGKYQFDL
jgi:uncharacterized protein